MLAVVLTMFSLESRPRPLPQGLAADVLFDGRLARVEASRIVRDHPDRRPGSPGDESAAMDVGRTLASRGFRTTLDRFDEDGTGMVNVVARRVGASRRLVVVMAPRDSLDAPDATGSAADTAALLELSRVLEGRATRKTLVLVSVDGSTAGSAGARRFAETVGDPKNVDAVIAISNLGARKPDGPVVVPWSNDTRRVSLGLESTAESSLREELGTLPRRNGPFTQLARLAAPIGLGEQGVLLERGVEAIRVSGSGELPPHEPGRDTAEIDPDRLGSLGRGVLRTVSALDAGDPPPHGPQEYISLGRKVLPGWGLVLLSGTLILPALLASVDAFARARRRRAPVSPYWRWLAGWTLPWLVGLVLAELIVLLGQAPDPPPAPLYPGAEPFDGQAAAVLGALTAGVVLGWLLLRPLVSRGVRVGDPPAPGAGVATALALSLLVLLMWLVNPFAALMLVPALHAWTLLLLAGEGPRTLGARVAVVGVGLLLPAFVLLVYLFKLDVGPLAGLWYGFLLVTGHQIGLATALVGIGLLGVSGAVAAVAAARRPRPTREPQAPQQSILGPGGYAGPGALGGTESALPR